MVGALFLAGCAQISFYLPGVPDVPVTMQTFGVLVLGPMLGPWLAAAASLVYYLAILAGLPFGAQQNAGVPVIAGGTGGYLVGFIFASYLVGYLTARNGYDRRWRYCILIMILCSFVIYVFGLIWLPFGIAITKGVSVQQAVCGFGHGCVGNVLMWGLVPFLPGDLIKIVLAWSLLPIGWKLLGRVASRTPIDITVDDRL